MKKQEIKNLAIKSVGADKYYDELTLLESDVKFFQLYMSREQKSNSFYFTPRVVYNGSRYAFDDIWRTYNYGETYLEEVYSIFVLLRTLIKNFHAEAYSEYENAVFVFTNDEKKEIIKLFQNVLELNVTDYVSDFIGCSQASEKTKETIDLFLSR